MLLTGEPAALLALLMAGPAGFHLLRLAGLRSELLGARQPALDAGHASLALLMVAMLTVPLTAPSWLAAATVLALAAGWLGSRSTRAARLPVAIGCASMALMCLRSALPATMTVGQPVGVLQVLGLMCMLAMLRRAFCTACLLRRSVSGAAGPVAATGCRLAMDLTAAAMLAGML